MLRVDTWVSLKSRESATFPILVYNFDIYPYILLYASHQGTSSGVTVWLREATTFRSMFKGIPLRSCVDVGEFLSNLLHCNLKKMPKTGRLTRKTTHKAILRFMWTVCHIRRCDCSDHHQMCMRGETNTHIFTVPMSNIEFLMDVRDAEGWAWISIIQTP